MKKSRKKIAALLFVITIAAGSLACSGNPDSEKTEDPPSVSVPEKNVPGMLLDCDSTEGISVKSYNDDFGITNAEGEYQEGTGALWSAGRNAVWWQVVLEEAVDISAYAEGGIHLWFYISETAKLNADVTVEIGSAGKGAANALQWTVKREKFTDGWNELVLKFVNAKKSEDGGADLTKVNFLRIYNSTNDGVTVRLDDVRAVEAQQVTVVLANCDDTTGMSVAGGKNELRIATGAEEHKEGTGAFKVVQQNQVMLALKLEPSVDASACEEGSLHFWIWFSDVSSLKENVRVELGSGGIYDKEEAQWNLDRDTLKDGWNEIRLLLSEASRSQDGGVDVSRINWFRVYSLNSDKIVTIIDDVYMIY